MRQNKREFSARERYKSKEMKPEEFQKISSQKWKPLKLEAEDVPASMRGLPAKVVAIFGSASLDTPNPVADGDPDYGQVGGIDVYRTAEVEDGVALNKDWYVIRRDPNTEKLYIIGPIRDAEHWIDEFPDRLAFALSSGVEAALKLMRKPEEDSDC
jgi:hypothetical protein